ncbi:septal ring lytic transglycosylase RlpA family protein [Rhizobium glycinendophyticum]|uniref:Endolytic peptidoglycan transglycosylase RlpA n=1 Tax=Rhizobium glycinendophyticum TaxID=2589807 RepID=A0A504UWK6_9HYPH|nr:septal ring lytic transglycosylase RlpA family protein [Rhizobium glycinendophyticum]TPP11141.1 septal ring lytic transglycosylase RlpA family protein [Rhizobium glycinendophyticum]
MHSSTGGRLAMGGKWLGVALMCAFTASCSTTKETAEKPKRSKEYFAESVYGVKASPRLVASGPVPKGGGRYMVGKPYVVKGETFVPKENPRYDEIGIASWYGDAFHGRLTANGELYDKEYLSAAHPTLPLPSYARVTNLTNGSSVIVRINDRGPFHRGRLIDLSNKTADMLDMAHSGTGKVRVQYVGPARMDGHDMPYLMASYVKKGERGPVIDPQGQIASGVMVASNDVAVPQYRPQPEPVYQTALSGSTPSGGAAPHTLDAQLLMTQPAIAPGMAAADGQVFVALPQIGPVPGLRPHHVPGYDGSGYAAAYAEERSTAGTLAFDAILVRNGGLTESSILSSVAKGGITLSKGL